MSVLTLFSTDSFFSNGHEFKTTPAMIKQSQSFAHPSRVAPPIPTVIEETQPCDPPARSRTYQKPQNSKSKYALAQPPPGAHLHISRERSLLVQVQKLSNSSRPIPVYDAVPAVAMQSTLKKVGHCLIHGSGIHDIALVTSEEYEESEDEDTSNYGVNGRQIKATISQVQRKGTHSAEDGKHKATIITLEDGTQWEANPLPSGGYEFLTIEKDGVVRQAKWLPKAVQPRRRSYQPGQRSLNESDGRRFQFSIYDRVTRRRPIVAWMTQRSLDILDRHPGTLATTDSPLQSPSESTDELGSPISRSSTPEETEFTTVPETLRILIIATGIWVSQREGLTKSPKTDDIPSSPSTVSFRNSISGRPTSLLVTPTTPTADKPSAFDDSITKRIHRRGTLLAHDATTHKAHRHENNDGLSLPKRGRSVSNGASRLINFNRLSKGPPSTPPPMDAVARPITPAIHPPAAPASEKPERFQPRKSYSAPTTPQAHDLSGMRKQLPRRALEDYDKPEKTRRLSRFRLCSMVSGIFKKSSPVTA